MKQDKVLSMLGIAAKAGLLSSGECQTEKAVKSRQARLVVVASDASENTKKAFRDMCAFYHAELVFYGDRESLGHSIGKEYRSSLAIMDDGLAKAVKKKLAQAKTE